MGLKAITINEIGGQCDRYENALIDLLKKKQTEVSLINTGDFQDAAAQP